MEWVPFPSPGDLPNPGMESRSPALQAGSLPSEPPGKPNSDVLNSGEKPDEKSFRVIIVPVTCKINWNIRI